MNKSNLLCTVHGAIIKNILFENRDDQIHSVLLTKFKPKKLIPCHTINFWSQIFGLFMHHVYIINII